MFVRKNKYFKILSVSLLIVMGALLFTACNNDTAQVETDNTNATQEFTSLDDAKELAVNDANVEMGDVIFIKAKLDRDNSVPVYEIEFITKQFQYEYEISATDKTVRESSKDDILKNIPIDSKGYLTIDEAKKAVLKDADLANENVHFKKLHFEMDDDTPTYEIEFIKDNVEYDYKIHALTGKVLEHDTEKW